MKYVMDLYCVVSVHMCMIITSNGYDLIKMRLHYPPDSNSCGSGRSLRELTHVGQIFSQSASKSHVAGSLGLIRFICACYIDKPFCCALYGDLPIPASRTGSFYFFAFIKFNADSSYLLQVLHDF